MVSDGIASATNTFTVIVTNLPVVPPPVIESISFANDVATVTWSTVEGRNYRLQFRDTPWSTNWTDSPPDIPGTGGSVNGTNVLNGAIQRFYRVLLVPLP